MKKLLLSLLMIPLLSADFGWSLLQDNQKNTLFSPYSISTCLSMTAAGARGDTLKAMEKLFPPHFEPVAHIKIANSLWVAPEFFILPSFRQTVENEFHASIAPVDFQNPEAAAQTINTWAADQTDQKISHLIAPGDLHTDTRLVLTNALYFTGQFLKPFNPKFTSSQPFWIDDNTSRETPMMNLTSSFFYGEDDQFQTVALPFEGSQIFLVIALPKGKITPFTPSLDQLQLAKVHVQLPKFTLRERLNLNQLLSNMGLSIAFTPEADFSGINGKKDLYLSKVLHEAYFALDENGVVAAAATAAAFNVTSAHVTTPPIEFIANHPFIFALIDFETEIPLFIGELFTP